MAAAKTAPAVETNVEEGVIAPVIYDNPKGMARLRLVGYKPHTSKFKNKETGEDEEVASVNLDFTVQEIIGNPEATERYKDKHVSTIVGLSRGPKAALTVYEKAWLGAAYNPKAPLVLKQVVADGCDIVALVKEDQKPDGRSFPKIVKDSVASA